MAYPRGMKDSSKSLSWSCLDSGSFLLTSSSNSSCFRFPIRILAMIVLRSLLFTIAKTGVDKQEVAKSSHWWLHCLKCLGQGSYQGCACFWSQDLTHSHDELPNHLASTLSFVGFGSIASHTYQDLESSLCLAFRQISFLVVDRMLN
jgi:hypothetical protein